MLLSVGAAQEIILSIILHTINHSKHKLSPCTKYGKDYYQIIPGYILAIGLPALHWQGPRLGNTPAARPSSPCSTVWPTTLICPVREKKGILHVTSYMAASVHSALFIRNEVKLRLQYSPLLGNDVIASLLLTYRYAHQKNPATYYI